MQTDWLVTFVAVVDHGGFSAAAEALHRSQSRVSAHVAELESEFGSVLLDRSQRPVALTDSGNAFIAHARAVMDRLEWARSEVMSVEGVVRGSVSLGSYPSASAAFVPGVLRRFMNAHPDVEVSLVERPPVQLERALAEREADVILRPLHPMPMSMTLAHRFLWRESLKVVVPQEHHLGRSGTPIAVETIVNERFITAGEGIPGESSFYEGNQALRRAGLEGEVRFRSNQPHTLLALVQAGLGIGLINELALSVCGDYNLRVLDIADPLAVRDVAVFWDEGAYESPAARALRAAILEAPVPPGVQPPVREQVGEE